MKPVVDEAAGCEVAAPAPPPRTPKLEAAGAAEVDVAAGVWPDDDCWDCSDEEVDAGVRVRAGAAELPPNKGFAPAPLPACIPNTVEGFAGAAPSVGVAVAGVEDEVEAAVDLVPKFNPPNVKPPPNIVPVGAGVDVEEEVRPPNVGSAGLVVDCCAVGAMVPVWGFCCCAPNRIPEDAGVAGVVEPKVKSGFCCAGVEDACGVGVLAVLPKAGACDLPGVPCAVLLNMAPKVAPDDDAPAAGNVNLGASDMMR